MRRPYDLPSLCPPSNFFAPVRLATSAWVSLAARRAFRSSSNIENSCSSASYSALKAASFFHFAIICSCVFMLHLTQSKSGNFQFFLRCLVGLFDKAVQHDDLVSNRPAVKHPCDPFPAMRADFKQPLAHRTRVRHSKVRSMHDHPLGDSGIAGADAHRQVIHEPHDVFTVVNDFPISHDMLTNLLICCNRISCQTP